MAKISQIQKVTLQASILNVVSTILAQLLQAYRKNPLPASSSSLNPLGLRFLPILQFLFCSLATTPPNFLWQEYLERQLPGYPADEQKVKVDDDGKVLTHWPDHGQVHSMAFQGVTIERKLDVKNTVLKLIIDQVVGGAANTILFLTLITAVRGGSVGECIAAARVVSCANCPSLFSRDFCMTGLSITLRPLTGDVGVLVAPVRRLSSVAFCQPS